MASVGKFVKAFFLGLVSKRRWRRSCRSRGRKAKRKQVVDVSSISQGSDDHLTPAVAVVNEDVLGVRGTIAPNTVFLGQLPDGSRIAIKRLDTGKMKGVEDFVAEAKTLGNVRHKNLLRLYGFCAEGKDRLIVYDYMVNLSVYTHLHGSLSSSSALDWSRRMNIAIGAAEGLAHLHHGAGQQFIHGEIKSRNLLLDVNYDPKWADFGLMRLMKDGCFKFGGSKGVVGYLPPEYHKGQGPSQSGDVFAFGIFLLELISGKEPSEELGSMGKKKSMWEWAEPLIAEGRYSELVDPRLEDTYSLGALNLVIYVATMCVQSSPSSRLTIMEAADLLKTCGNVCRHSGEIVLVP